VDSGGAGNRGAGGAVPAADREGAPIEEFNTGINTVQVFYWKVTEGRSFQKSFVWQFDVV